MYNFEGKVALVTGAGRAIAQHLTREGAKVYFIDINYEAVKKLEDEFKASGYNVKAAHRCV